MVKYLHAYQSILFVLLGLEFSITSNFRASKALREMCENMYCAKISMFTVVRVFLFHDNSLYLTLSLILQGGSKVQSRVGLLMLLAHWLAQCPLAITHFLHNAANVPFVSFCT